MGFIDGTFDSIRKLLARAHTWTGTQTFTTLTDGTAQLSGGALTGITTAHTVAQGGTGAATFTDGGILVGNGANTIAATAAGATTEILVGSGAGVDPVWTAATGTGAPARAGSPTFTTQITTPIVALTGGQIAFPATAALSADANTLDDYEEGTWTPDLQFGGAKVDITYAVGPLGYYTKVGSIINLTGYFDLSSKGTSNGDVTISGMPFAVPNQYYGYTVASLWMNGVTFANQFQAQVIWNTTHFTISEITEAGVVTSLTDANFANDSIVTISVIYRGI